MRQSAIVKKNVSAVKIVNVSLNAIVKMSANAKKTANANLNAIAKNKLNYKIQKTSLREVFLIMKKTYAYDKIFISYGVKT